METRTPFTMIELMVVIAVIAVLCAVLLPALQNAKERARGIVCAGQLKQFGAAAMMYVGDNIDFLPFSTVDSNLWDVLLAPYVNYNSTAMSTMNSYSVYHCPSAGDLCPVAVSRYRYRSYAFNFNFTAARGRKLGSFKKPSAVCLMCDASYGEDQNYANGWVMCSHNNMYAVDQYSYLGTLSYRHVDKANFLHADGHVAMQGKASYTSNGWLPRDVVWNE